MYPEFWAGDVSISSRAEKKTSSLFMVMAFVRVAIAGCYFGIESCVKFLNTQPFGLFVHPVRNQKIKPHENLPEIAHPADYSGHNDLLQG
jgi:hypothetical protein